MDRYLAWNNALAAHFFHPGMAGTPVYLFVTEDVITEVGRTIADGPEGFFAAVRAGPRGTTRSGHCQRALQTKEGWRHRGLEFPPYVAYLALFALAGVHEGDYAPQSYYPGLWSLLGEHRTDTLPSFKRMFELWDDLEQWSVHDRDGDLGVFEARIVGGKVHVGLPLAQTILTGAERDDLPRLFSKAKLDPGRVASSRELLRALMVHGRAFLRPRTMRALEHRSGTFQEALLDAVAEDFSTWDGSVPATIGGQGACSVFAGLRFCLGVDLVARTVRASLRLFTRRDYPDDPLKITGLTSGALEGTEFYDGWSTPLRVPGSGSDYEPGRLAWRSGLTGADERIGWRFRLEPAQVRVFVEGQALLLPGLVEMLELPRDAPFYVAFHDSAANRIGEWLMSECEGWKPLAIALGLPSGWTFGRVDRALSDRGVLRVRSELGHPDRVSMSIVEGVRASGRNTYFSFAPPRLAVRGLSVAQEVRVAGRPVAPSVNSGYTYGLPEDLPTDSRIALEVLDGDEVVRRSSLYLVSGVPWRFERPFLTVDEFGESTERGTICGAAVVPTHQVHFPQDLLRTPGLRSPEERVYFVGRCRGEIAVWPDEPTPTWEVVWAVPFRRRGRAIFCGTSIADTAPLPTWVGSRSRRKLWYSLLWRRRKQITPPSDRAQKSLWLRYKKAARDH